MPHVLTVKDKNYTLFSVRDFYDIIAEHLGYESAAYFEKLMEEKNDIIKQQEIQIMDLKEML